MEWMVIRYVYDRSMQGNQCFVLRGHKFYSTYLCESNEIAGFWKAGELALAFICGSDPQHYFIGFKYVVGLIIEY